MPQVDLETLVSACAAGSCDSKIACETLAPAAAAEDTNHKPTESESESDQPDFPPESFCLSKDAVLDWFDRNAFIERKDSTKGNSSSSTNLNPNLHPSNSQRFSNLKSKASLIGLPMPQKSRFVDVNNRRNCKPGPRLFTKRSGSSGKSDSSQVEPSSPKVSCIGRVRSKRDRNRRIKNRQRSTGTECKTKKSETGQKAGFFSSLRAIFGPGPKQTHNKDKNDASQRQSVGLPTKSESGRTSDADTGHRLPAADTDAGEHQRKSVGLDGVEPAGLGGMKRFASGRKSDSWASIIDVA